MHVHAYIDGVIEIADHTYRQHRRNYLCRSQT